MTLKHLLILTVASACLLTALASCSVTPMRYFCSECGVRRIDCQVLAPVD